VENRTAHARGSTPFSPLVSTEGLLFQIHQNSLTSLGNRGYGWFIYNTHTFQTTETPFLQRIKSWRINSKTDTISRICELEVNQNNFVVIINQERQCVIPCDSHGCPAYQTSCQYKYYYYNYQTPIFNLVMTDNFITELIWHYNICYGEYSGTHLIWTCTDTLLKCTILIDSQIIFVNLSQLSISLNISIHIE
jgi:hypothetical protein